MKKYSTATFLLLTISLIIGSCRKNGDDAINPLPEPVVYKRVKKLASGPNDHMIYTYNQQNQVSSYKSTWIYSPDGPVIKTYTLNYEFVNGKIKEGINNGGTKVVFSYEGNRISTAGFYYPNGNRFATHTYTYNNKNQLTEITETIMQPEQISEVRALYQYDPNGNLIKIVNQHKRTGTNQFELISSTIFEAYDTHWNPIPDHVWGQFLPGLILHKNNPKRIKELLPDGSVKQVLHITYTYRPDGFPREKVQYLEINGQDKPAIRYTYDY